MAQGPKADRQQWLDGQSRTTIHFINLKVRHKCITKVYKPLRAGGEPMRDSNQ